ncbi:MAG TPA: NAD(P)-dependent oxidoreductase [Nevskiaceae bacterium]
MRIALIGASGFVGSAVRIEALARGHRVTALVGHPERIEPAENLTVRKVDALQSDALAAEFRDQDAVISAFSGHAQKDVYGYYMKGFASIVAAVKKAGVPRFLIVGGAGSLEVAPGKLLYDTPEFPSQWKDTARGALDALRALRHEPSLNWTMVTPAAEMAPGKRTGKFRTGGNQLLTDREGKSRISVQDLAAAMIDELEQPKHPRARFSVAY